LAILRAAARHRIAPYRVPDRPSQGEKHGQELVHADQHEVIVPGLLASGDVLLREPVSQLADDTGDNAHPVGEHGREERHKDEPENPCAGQPPASVPPGAYACANAEHDQGDPQRDLQTLRAIVQGIPAEQLDHQRRGKRQNERANQHHKIKGRQPGEGVPSSLGTGQPLVETQRRQEGAHDGIGDKRGLFAAKSEGQRCRCDVQIPRPGLHEVTKAGDNQGEVEEDRKLVMAYIARAVHEHRRDGHEQRRGQHSFAAKPSAHGQRCQNDRNARQRGRQATGDVRIPQDSEHQRRDVIQERPMVDRVVNVSLTRGQLPGLPGMDALVVTVTAASQVP